MEVTGRRRKIIKNGGVPAGSLRFFIISSTYILSGNRGADKIGHSRRRKYSGQVSGPIIESQQSISDFLETHGSIIRKFYRIFATESHLHMCLTTISFFNFFSLIHIMNKHLAAVLSSFVLTASGAISAITFVR